MAERGACGNFPWEEGAVLARSGQKGRGVIEARMLEVLGLVRWEPVQVTWVDSSGKSSWTRIDEEIERLEKRTLVCSTVGFFFHLNGLSMTVALNRDHDLPNVGETMQIPLVAVQSVRRLVARDEVEQHVDDAG